MLSIRTETLDACPICGCVNSREFISAYDFETGTGRYNVRRCLSCDVGFTTPRPVKEDIPLLYESRTSADFPTTTALTAWLRGISLQRSISKLLRSTRMKDVDMLDYGCGDALFAIQATKHPHVRSVTAVDFHSTPPPIVLQQAEASLEYVTMDEYEKSGRQYGLIILRHVLEHSLYPQELLASVQDRLLPGGHLFIEVPNLDACGTSLFRSHYYALYLPRHLVHFSFISLVASVDGAFTVLSITGAHLPVWGRSIGNIAGKVISNTGLLGIALFPIQVFCEKITGRASVITLLARKHT